ncbi:flavodoxin family protein [Candidatus Latescibacterota bacterium]
MKKILGISGSPRKNGNTHILVSEILRGAAKAGAATEIVSLDNLDIKECNGCHTCWKGLDCVKNDDMNGLFERIADSDAVIFGTPVYWYGPTAIMKAFLDRFVYFNCPENRAKIKGKQAVVAVPFEEDNPETASLITAMFERSFDYLEMNYIGAVIAPGVGEKGEMRTKPDILHEAYELGKTLASY